MNLHLNHRNAKAKMPQAANIVINDGASTPVAHTFSPANKDSKGVLWYEQTSPAPTSVVAAKRIGYKQVRGNMYARQAIENGKIVLSVLVPTADSLGTSDSGYLPAPRVAYKESVRIELDICERSTKQERKDTRVLSSNLLLSAMAIAAIDDLQVTFA